MSKPVEFPGGEKAFFLYINEKIKYPVEAREQGIESSVLLRFTIGKSGKTADIQVLEGIGGGCDDEAIRVIRELPCFSPALQNWQRVSSPRKLRIKFQLD